jgi:hypothetical protein
VHCRKHCGTRNLHDPQGRPNDGGHGAVGDKEIQSALEEVQNIAATEGRTAKAIFRGLNGGQVVFCCESGVLCQ